jgi:diguanylate cyclase (GGDEF)-like protein
MVATWRSIAWWAPMLSASLVLVIWWAHDKALDLTRDPMTGILNERGFRPRLNRAIQEARLHGRLSLLAILDLDQFKEVNDHYGHDAGDEVIRVTARRLTAATRATDAVSRSHRAGDEFAVLLEGVKDPSLAETLARRLHDRLCEPIVLREDGRSVGVGASLGAVVLDGTVASADEAVRIADWRMYEAKIGQLGVVATGWPPGEAPAAGDQAKASAS